MAAESETVATENVRAQLVAPVNAVEPGQTFEVALRLRHNEKWHTYWENPGDAGMTTMIDWSLPEGFTAGSIHWPTPTLYMQGDDDFRIANYVYEGETLLIIPITAPENFAGETVTIAAQVDWLECAEICVPGSARLSLDLAVGVTENDPRWAEAFSAYKQKHWPKTPDGLQARAESLGEDKVLLRVESQEPFAENLDGLFYFDADAVIAPSGEQLLSRPDAQTLVLELQMSESSEVPETLRGILKAPSGLFAQGDTVGIQIDAAFASPEDAALPVDAPGLTLALALTAFLGGLILNLMPCVFPVLGIKIMGFVNQAGEDRKKIILHGLLFTLGVLVSFWLLAGLLLFLRLSLGLELGWGFQLQEPLFVLGLIVFLFIFGLNMAGLFEVGGSLVGTGSELQNKGGLSGTFFSGVLATVVATPCSAPFLAGALGPALALPPLQSLILFTAIALGLSTPYLLLSAFPALIKKLPRPGAWMETFKQALSFLLFGTVAWLVWVLTAQVSADVLLKSLLTLVLIALAAWLYGRFGQSSRKKATRRGATAIAGLIVLGSLLFTIVEHRQYARQQVQIAAIEAGEIEQDFLIWEKWTPEKEAALLAEGRPVYVDFTARWCATCQTNKASYRSEAVVRAFLDNNVATLKADWTNQDPVITRRLEKLGKAAVPVNALYLPGKEAPILFPELLTSGIVLEELNEHLPEF